MENMIDLWKFVLYSANPKVIKLKNGFGWLILFIYGACFPISMDEI